MLITDEVLGLGGQLSVSELLKFVRGKFSSCLRFRIDDAFNGGGYSRRRRCDTIGHRLLSCE